MQNIDQISRAIVTFNLIFTTFVTCTATAATDSIKNEIFLTNSHLNVCNSAAKYIVLHIMWPHIISCLFSSFPIFLHHIRVCWSVSLRIWLNMRYKKCEAEISSHHLRLFLFKLINTAGADTIIKSHDLSSPLLSRLTRIIVTQNLRFDTIINTIITRNTFCSDNLISHCCALAFKL